MIFEVVSITQKEAPQPRYPRSPKPIRVIRARSNSLRLKRAVAVCESCGWTPPNVQYVPKYNPSRLFHLHHIKPLCCGGPDTRENRVALCPNCHALAHAVTRRYRSRGHWYLWGPSTKVALLAALRGEKGAPQVTPFHVRGEAK